MFDDAGFADIFAIWYAAVLAPLTCLRYYAISRGYVAASFAA